MAASLLMIGCSRQRQISQEDYNAKWGIVRPATGRWYPTTHYVEESGFAEAVRATRKHVDAQKTKNAWIVDTEYFVKKLDSGYLVFLTDILGYNSKGLPIAIPDAGLKVIIDTNMTVREVLGQP